MKVQNILNLLKRYFIESRKKDLTTALLVILITAFLTFISVSDSDGGGLLVIVLYIMALIYAAKVFRVFQPAGRAIHYLTLPASSLEKTIANGILVFIYYNLLLIVSLLLGYVIGGLLQELLSYFLCKYSNAHLDCSYSYQFHMPFSVHNIIVLIVFESIFMFGSVYFKTHSFIKTALILFGFLFFLFVIDGVIMGSYLMRIQGISPRFVEDIQNSFIIVHGELIENILSVLIFLFFGFMTWLRLRETEV